MEDENRGDKKDSGKSLKSGFSWITVQQLIVKMSTLLVSTFLEAEDTNGTVVFRNRTSSLEY